MEILLVNPPPHRRTYTYYTHSLGLASIAAVLEENGYKPKILDFFRDSSWKKINRILEKEQPDVVGITCLTNIRMNALKVAEIVKTIHPQTIVVMGGAHPSVMYEQILEQDPVDIIVIGEGEITFLDLVETIKGNKPIHTVKGIAYKMNGKVLRTEPRPYIEDLDLLPTPSYHHFQLTENDPKGRFLIKDVALSRGCPFHCSFCASSNVWGHSYRTRGVKRAVDDIEAILEKSFRSEITINDDSFGLDEERAIEFCQEILSRELKLNWTAKTRVDCISEETLHWMKKSGCNGISYGVESGSQEILKNINKRITVDQIVRTFKLTHQVGIRCEATIMVGNPGETAQTIKETERLLSIIEPDHIWVCFTAVYPGTGLYELAKSEGFINDEYWLSDLVAPIYTRSIPFKKMVYYKWRINLSQLWRRKQLWEFFGPFIAEFHPNRISHCVKLVRKRYLRL